MRSREDRLDENIKFQSMVMRDMNMAIPNTNNPGPGAFCCNDPHSGKPLTYAEFYDMHAMTMMVIAEIVERTKK